MPVIFLEDVVGLTGQHASSGGVCPWPCFAFLHGAAFRSLCWDTAKWSWPEQVSFLPPGVRLLLTPERQPVPIALHLFQALAVHPHFLSPG